MITLTVASLLLAYATPFDRTNRYEAVPRTFVEAIYCDEKRRILEGPTLALLNFDYSKTVKQQDIPKPLVNHAERWLRHTIAKQYQPKEGSLNWIGYRTDNFDREPMIASWNTPDNHLVCSTMGGSIVLVIQSSGKEPSLTSSEVADAFVNTKIKQYLDWPIERTFTSIATRMQSSEARPVWLFYSNVNDPETQKPYGYAVDLGEDKNWYLNILAITDGTHTLIRYGTSRIQKNGFDIDPAKKTIKRNKSRFDLKDDDFDGDLGLD